jgi:hypothetical protein
VSVVLDLHVLGMVPGTEELLIKYLLMDQLIIKRLAPCVLCAASSSHSMSFTFCFTIALISGFCSKREKTTLLLNKH